MNRKCVCGGTMCPYENALASFSRRCDKCGKIHTQRKRMPASVYGKVSRKDAEKLAKEVVDAWDMDTLVAAAIDNLTEFYLNPSNQGKFNADWKENFPDSPVA